MTVLIKWETEVSYLIEWLYECLLRMTDLPDGMINRISGLYLVIYLTVWPNIPSE